ncbi:hypothetical protein AB0J35_12775 [Nonomuraea angiospora]|uniref:hypothetical protein n=1 Tax=Nonomuraea angiospora TaxID=46172 RepID=UPI003439FA03
MATAVWGGRLCVRLWCALSLWRGSDLARWRGGFADLDVVRRRLAVFDAKHPMRLAFADYLTTRYGPDPAVHFLTLHRHIQRELAGTRRGRARPWIWPRICRPTG